MELEYGWDKGFVKSSIQQVMTVYEFIENPPMIS